MLGQRSGIRSAGSIDSSGLSPLSYSFTPGPAQSEARKPEATELLPSSVRGGEMRRYG